MKQNKQNPFIKIHILFDFKSLSGGGNNFLKALKMHLVANNHYVDDPIEADIVLINSYQYLDSLFSLIARTPNILIVHRVDGPIRLYNRISDVRDYITNYMNKNLADGTIFQSQWSRKLNKSMGLSTNRHEVVIHNAPNPRYFYREKNQRTNKGSKIKLITTSWSANLKKGFEVYRWLDDNIDFNKYDYTFIGNSPIKFNNIKVLKPMGPSSLGRKLRSHDIFIGASKIEACSNAVLEALSCGLPVIAPNTSSYSELIRGGGKLYISLDELKSSIEEISSNIDFYQKNIKLQSIDKISKRYLDFFKMLYRERNDGVYKAKRFKPLTKSIYKFLLVLNNFEVKLHQLYKKITNG